jgi:plastocyanin/D-arabinose 5-phosphate isomerase GutQ
LHEDNSSVADGIGAWLLFVLAGGASGRWPNRSKREPRHFTNMNNRNTDRPGLNKKRRFARSLGLVLAALLLATTATAATTVTVQVAPNGDLSFSPDPVSIQPGDTVKWVWADSGMPHSVTSGNGVSDGKFDSGLHQSSTFTFSFTFPNAGTFPYYCIPHFDLGMTGTVNVSALSSELGNISTRAFVQTGDNVMIGGLIITGSGQKKVIVRAIGPSLVNHGITNPLQNPTLELHDHTGAVIASNDNWMNAPNRQEIINSGLAPSNNLESAILTSLNPGAYTAIVRGVTNGTGIALVEAYDLDLTAGSKLGNISTRALVQTGNNVMIGGLIITGTGQKNVIARAIGPSLAQHGITNPLLDPTLELHNGNGAVIASNDNWRDSQQAEIQATGLAPTDDRESAIVRSLTPGNYTAIVRGKNNTIGVALVEVYGLN